MSRQDTLDPLRKELTAHYISNIERWYIAGYTDAARMSVRIVATTIFTASTENQGPLALRWRPVFPHVSGCSNDNPKLCIAGPVIPWLCRASSSLTPEFPRSRNPLSKITSLVSLPAEHPDLCQTQEVDTKQLNADMAAGLIERNQ